MLKQIARDREHASAIEAKEGELARQKVRMQAEIDALHAEVDALVQNWSQDISRLHRDANANADTDTSTSTMACLAPLTMAAASTITCTATSMITGWDWIGCRSPF